MYNSTKWLDKVVDAETGELIQEGTNQSAANFNNMEEGILDAHIAAALMQIAIHQTPQVVCTPTNCTGNIWAKKTERIISVNGIINLNTTLKASTGSIKIGNLEGYKPNKEIFGTAHINGKGTTMALINTLGEVSISNFLTSDIETTDKIYFGVTGI